MNILERIFKQESLPSQKKFSEQAYSLLLDWFKRSNISIQHFETLFFEPILQVLNTLEPENRHTEDYFELKRRNHYVKFSFMYLMAYCPDNDLLKRFFHLDSDKSLVNDVTNWYSHATLATDYPDLFFPLTVGTNIAKYYHAIHERFDHNLSYLPSHFDYLKFDKDEAKFNAIFGYVNNQVFEEKPYLMFLLHKSTREETKYADDGSGNIAKISQETILVTPYDRIIDAALEKAIEEYNGLYKANLSKDVFLLLKDLLSYEPSSDKKISPGLDSFIKKHIKGRELIVLEHIIYFLSNTNLPSEKYWQSVFTTICQNWICTTDWLVDKIELLLFDDGELRSYSKKNKFRNFNLIFKYLVSPLFKHLASELRYHDPLVQKYELMLFNQMGIPPHSKSLETLHSIASTSIEDDQERAFVLNKLSAFYAKLQPSAYSTLHYDRDDKTNATINAFVADLNVLAPIALKKINKLNYYDDSKPEMMILNYAGEDIAISDLGFIKDINTLLKKLNTPYRLVTIPLMPKEGFGILCAIAFMNKREYNYFKANILTDDNIAQWREGVKEYQALYFGFSENIKTSQNLHPEFTQETDVSFIDFKKEKENNKDTKADRNVFLSDVNWEWFKVKYVDELNSKDHWYDIMHVICQCPKGKEPSSAWLSQLRAEIEKLGTEKCFNELQVLVSESLKEESWFFGTYTQALRGIIWSCAYIDPNDVSLSILKTIAEYAYTKVRGSGPRSAAVGNLVLNALVATQKEEAFGVLNIMKDKTKYNSFAIALDKSIDKFKENSTIPEQLLADRAIPVLGFKEGKRIFGIGDYKLVITFQKRKLVKKYEDKEGREVKKLPMEQSEELAKTLKEITEEIKKINSVFSDLGKRIKTYWLYDRVWSFSDWDKYIKSHDLIYLHIEGLVWTNKTQQSDFIVLGNQLLDADGKLTASNPEDEICLWHPVMNDEGNISKWQNYLWENNIVQSQRQVFRESYPFSNTELELLRTPRFAHHFLEVQKLMALANKTGWIFTYMHVGWNWPRIYLKPLNITAHLTCDYDHSSYAIPTKELHFTQGNSTKIETWEINRLPEKIKLSEVPLVTLSELCRDIDLFIATTSIANNVELSKRRQQYDTYRLEYEKGLFSEDANAKVRKQIIEKLIPVLKLNIEKFEGNFLIIKGKTNNYKINLNSGFAQASETNKHLNLIPDVKKLKSDKKVRLPIEDDETLYIILAKMLYLQTL